MEIFCLSNLHILALVFSFDHSSDTLSEDNTLILSLKNCWKNSAIFVTALPLLISSFALRECLSNYELLLKGKGPFH